MWNETDGRQEKLWWQDYVKLNQKFAQKIVELYKPGDISMSSMSSNDSLGPRLFSRPPTSDDQKGNPKCKRRPVRARSVPIVGVLSLSS